MPGVWHLICALNKLQTLTYYLFIYSHTPTVETRYNGEVTAPLMVIHYSLAEA